MAERDWVAYNVRHEGTHEGEFEGVAPTGKRVEFRTMVFNHFADGVVVENWGLHDHASAIPDDDPHARNGGSAATASAAEPRQIAARRRAAASAISPRSAQRR